MGVPTREVGCTTPPPEGRPRSSGEHVVALDKKKSGQGLKLRTTEQLKQSIYPKISPEYFCSFKD
jgi:hypothetical protein